jgi:hypothetical protein
MQLLQKGIFGARAETSREMAGAAARIGQKRKGGGKDSVTSHRAPSPISTPYSCNIPNLQNFKTCIAFISIMTSLHFSLGKFEGNSNFIKKPKTRSNANKTI